LLDELDGEIRRNFDRRGWLPLMDISHPPSATLIKEFYSNLFVHFYDSNTLVRSWIQSDEYTITPSIVAVALRVPLVQHPVYPYDESPPLNDIMSYIISTSIQWGSDTRITFAELTEIHYIFFWIACHSLWPISHLHTILIECCVFLYALVTYASMSFPHLFIRSFIKVHRSSSTTHALFFPIFIHRILLHLGFEQFPSLEPIHIITPIGATFLRQRAAQIRSSSRRPRVESFGVVPPPPSFTSDTSAEASVDPTAAATDVVPLPFTSDDSDIRRMLETVMFVQAAHG